MKEYIESLQWRYATKKFDATKKVSQENLDIILESARLSASSYGLQPYHIFVINDEGVRKQLQPVSWGQTQIVDASHLLVIANKTEVDEDWINSYLKDVSETRNIPLESLDQYGDFMKSKVLALTPEERANWTSKQAYIALGNLMSAAALLKIDTCPMEGFEPEAYNSILNLTEKGLNAALVLPIGYRSSEDGTQHFSKVRQSKKDFIQHI
ncbi:NAD(P)H-dependent oxidoreductase [Maribacter sp. 2210JD10-5]|uniref:NAD(P)H-dependent oxidoreductase n=1 Tax=Maribacter sp. 2210JD10-5 TaxID=3386272 RepID=UPI0039BCF242